MPPRPLRFDPLMDSLEEENSMLRDLVYRQIDNYDSYYLEPAERELLEDIRKSQEN